MSSQASCVEDIVASAEDRFHRDANMGFIYSDCTLRVCSIPPPFCRDGNHSLHAGIKRKAIEKLLITVFFIYS